MNRTEQKESLSDILLSVADLKVELRDKIKGAQKSFDKIDELDDVLADIENIDSWDSEELKNDVLRAVLEDSLEVVYDQIYAFKSELESYIEDISENRREKIEERYTHLEDALNKFSYGEQEYEDIENAIENIEEAEQMIKDMKK